MKRNKPSILYEAMGNISDAYISEAADTPKVNKWRGRYVAALAACLALILILPTFALITSLQDPLRRYRDDPYYNVIASIVRRQNEAEYLKKIQEKGFFEKLFGIFKAGAPSGDRIFTGSAANSSGSLLEGGSESADRAPDSEDKGPDHDNITDNQVDGVLEADVIKRNSTHIFYLRLNCLTVYTLAGEESREVTTIPLTKVDDETSYTNFYLFGDHLILEGVHHKDSVVYTSDGRVVEKNIRDTDGGVYTRLLMLSIEDILDGKVDEETPCATLQGSLISTRLTNGDLLVMCGYYYYGKTDFESDAYLPHYETEDGMVAISHESITAPEHPSESFYTAVYLLGGESLAVKDAHALLGTPSAQYVSENAVYLVSESVSLISQNGEATVFEYEFNKDRRCVKTKTVSYIEAIAYSSDGFTTLGGISVDGSVKDQYSLDEYEGVLRLATSTSEWSYVLNGRGNRVNGTTRERNASLYLISLDDFSILSYAEKFAPSGETVQSARFDDTVAYICTAEIVTFTDPVYRFDLSDPKHITSLDTGTIDGYSTSLIELKNGDLLGIGYGANRDTLKLEIYRKGEEKLISVASYEISDCNFSEDYKSYYINREASLFGVPVYVFSEKIGGTTYYEHQLKYLLFSYGGEALTVAESVYLSDSNMIDATRGFVYEGYLYVLHIYGIKVAPISCATNG